MSENKESDSNQTDSQPTKTRENKAESASSPHILSFYKQILLSQIHHKKRLLLILISFVFTLTYFSSIPFLFKKIFDHALPTHNAHLLFVLLAICLILFLLFSLSSIFEAYAASRIGADFANGMRLRVFRHMQHFNFQTDAQYTEQSLLTMMSEDLLFMEQACISSTWTTIRLSFLVLVSGLLLFYIHWPLALLVLLFLPLFLWLSDYLSKKASTYSDQKKSSETKLFSTTKENLEMQTSTQLLQINNYQRKMFKNILKQNVQNSFFGGFFVNLTGRMGFIGINFIWVITLSVGTCLVLFTSSMTVGILLGFLYLLDNIQAGVTTIVDQYPMIFRGARSLHRIQKFLASPTPIEHHGQETSQALTQKIELRSLSFKQRASTLLSNIDTQLDAKKFIVITGPSGSGKTTLLALLSRLQKPSIGKILFDGIDIQAFTNASFYKTVSVVLQRSLLFPISIRENIRLGKLDASDEEIISAAKAAEIHDEILQLPEAYDTPIYRTSHLLSTGQYQRIVIARSLVANPSVLFLDEATASLDPLAADALVQTLKKMTKHLTVIFCTHQLEIAMSADDVLVMDKGYLVEQGQHAELMLQEGLYYRLWNKQHGVTLTLDMHQAKIHIFWLKTIPLFHSLSEPELQILSKQFMIERFEPEIRVIEEGQSGNKFYVVVYGELLVYTGSLQEKHILAKLSAGDYFGEIALLFDQPRNASVLTQGVAIVLSLSRYQFRGFLEMLPKKTRQQILETAKSRSNSEPKST